MVLGVELVVAAARVGDLLLRERDVLLRRGVVEQRSGALLLRRRRLELRLRRLLLGGVCARLELRVLVLRCDEERGADDRPIAPRSSRDASPPPSSCCTSLSSCCVSASCRCVAASSRCTSLSSASLRCAPQRQVSADVITHDVCACLVRLLLVVAPARQQRFAFVLRRARSVAAAAAPGVDAPASPPSRAGAAARRAPARPASGRVRAASGRTRACSSLHCASVLPCARECVRACVSAANRSERRRHQLAPPTTCRAPPSVAASVGRFALRCCARQPDRRASASQRSR